MIGRGITPLQRPFSQTIIYELHVRGFTSHPSSGVAEEKRGTFAGLIEKIPYLPTWESPPWNSSRSFNLMTRTPPRAGQLLGLLPGLFLRPPPGLLLRTDPLAVLDEFRDMVKALHRAGIEVIPGRGLQSHRGREPLGSHPVFSGVGK